MLNIFLNKRCILLLGAILILLPISLQGQNQQPSMQADSAQVEDTVNMKTQMVLESLLERLQNKQQEKQGALDLEIDGLIVDNTVTKMGRDFYEIFINKWEAPANAKNFTITIRELPALGIATAVVVEINDHQVVEVPLQPRYEVIEGIAAYAVGKCYEYLEHYEQIQQELSGDDLSGSGIY